MHNPAHLTSEGPSQVYIRFKCPCARPQVLACRTQPFFGTRLQVRRASFEREQRPALLRPCTTLVSAPLKPPPLAHGVRARAHRLGWPSASRAHAPHLRVRRRSLCMCAGVRRSARRTVRHTAAPHVRVLDARLRTVCVRACVLVALAGPHEASGEASHHA